jgi:Chagasin family peptidase inhibitor I42.
VKQKLIVLAGAVVSILSIIGMSSALTDERRSAETISRTMTVTKDSPFTIDLPCAAGRGFSWQLADSSSFQSNVQFIRQTFDLGPVDKDGADGVQHFYFKATAPGTATIKFIYVQPFRKPYPKDARTTDITVRIEKHSGQK